MRSVSGATRVLAKAFENSTRGADCRVLPDCGDDAAGREKGGLPVWRMFPCSAGRCRPNREAGTA